MKRIIGILVAVCLLVSLACGAFAEQVSAEEQLQYAEHFKARLKGEEDGSI